MWTKRIGRLTLFVRDSENANGPRYFGGYKPDNPKEYGAYLGTSARFTTESQAVDYVLSAANACIALNPRLIAQSES